MRKVYIVSIISLIIIIKCSVVSEHPIEKQVFNYFIDSIISKNFTHYDLCGTFNNEYNDSILKLNLSAIDTLVDVKEDENLIKQYHHWGDKEIKILLNNPESYTINRNTNYLITGQNSIINHFSLSAPLITNDKNKAIILFTGYKSGQNGSRTIYLHIHKSQKDGRPMENLCY